MRESMNLENPEYYKMLTVTRSAVQKNMGKAYLTAIVLMLLKLLVSYLCSSPLSMALSSSMPAFSLIAFYACIMILLQFVTGLLTYGMIKTCTDMILNRPSYVRTLLFAFNKKEAWKISAFTTALYFLSIAITSAISLPLVLYILKTHNLTLSSPHVLSFLILGLSLLMFIVNIAVNLPFMFAVNISLENENKSLLENLKKSFSFLKGRMLHFAGFAFYSAAKNIAIIIASVFFTLALPALAFILELIVILEILTIVIKLYFSIPVYYYSLLAVNGLLKKNNESEGKVKDSNQDVDSDESSS